MIGLLSLRPPEPRPLPREPLMVQWITQEPTEPPKPVPVIPKIQPKTKPTPKPPTPPTPQVVQPEPQPVLAVAETAPAPRAAPAPPPQPPEPQSSPPAASGPVQAPVVTAAPPPISPPSFTADYLHNPAPQYPPLSRRLGESGRVILRVLVTPGGTAERVELRTSSGSRRLDSAALETVQRWKFVPARQGDTPVAAWVLVPILFTLEG